MAKKKKGVDPAWKAANYSKEIKVSEATVKKLRKGKMADNIAAANKPGASEEYKEAVRRFYGKNKVKDSTGASSSKSKAPKSLPKLSTVDPSKKGSANKARLNAVQKAGVATVNAANSIYKNAGPDLVALGAAGRAVKVVKGIRAAKALGKSAEATKTATKTTKATTATKKAPVKKSSATGGNSSSIDQKIVAGGKKGLSTKSEVSAAKARIALEKSVAKRGKAR